MIPGTAGAQRLARARHTGCAGDRRRARAFIVLAILVVLFVGSLYAIVTGLNTATASMKLSRNEANAAVLKEAKEGLIAWAATRADDGPGHLPCPDRNVVNSAFAGYREATCVGAAARIGRLPFRTLGLPDLRDTSGERLWYVLSPGFRDAAAVPVNSDTQGALTVEGMSAAGGVVAIIFAPGAVVGNQVRDTAVSNIVGNYLEARNPYVADAFLAWSGCEASACALPFNGGAPVNSAYNDQFIVVTHEDLFRVVEAVAQRRIEQEIAPGLSNPSGAAGYFELWGADVYGDARRGFFPPAAPYDDPARPRDDYRGAVAQIAGLLPVSTNTAAWVQWNTSVAKTNPLSTGTLDTIPPATCGPVCTINYTCTGLCQADGGLGITVTMRLRNAANSLVLPTGITTSADWSVPVPSVGASPAVAIGPRSFDTATGDLLFALTFTLPPTVGAGVTPPVAADLTLPAATFSPITATTNWFIANEWYRQTYYAISDGFRLRADLATRVIDPLNAGYAPCQPESDPPTMPADACVRVRNGPAQVRAVLVLAGRNRAGGTRPYAIGNYFELQNADVPAAAGAPANLLFERGLRTSDFNDRVVVVTPEPVP